MKFPTSLASLLLGAAALTAHAADPTSGFTLKGEVLEIHEAGSYTYLLLKTKGGESWAAVPATAVKKGAEVTVGEAAEMKDFESRTLKRTFDKIVFGQIIGPNTPGPLHQAAAPAPAAVSKLSRASGPDSHTVAEVVQGKAALKGKAVLVRGQVVKINLDILGKNWLHLQDGSGSASDGSNDILVTTEDRVEIGDVVNARGTVRTDVNVGPGYAFAVLIEDAVVRQ